VPAKREGARPISTLEFRLADPADVPFEIGRLETTHRLRTSRRPHRHGFHEILWVVDGAGSRIVDFEERAIQPQSAAAPERRSLAVASPWPFDQWGRFLPEHTTAAALLDRLLHHAVVVVTSGESFRLRESRTRGGAHPTTA
jgi:hypothetical protein